MVTIDLRKSNSRQLVDDGMGHQHSLLPEPNGPQQTSDSSLQLVFESMDSKELRTGKHVSFDGECRVWTTLHIDDYTDDEYFGCWYTPEELDEMKGNMVNDMLHKLERNEKVDEVKNDAFRDLETHTTSGRRHKGRSRTNAIEAVVGIYYRLAKVGKKLDEKEVAGAYKECNKASELAAYLHGVGDYVTARDLDMSFNSEVIRQKKGNRRCGFRLFATRSYFKSTV